MEYSLDRTATDIIEQLEGRLRRIEHVTSGQRILKDGNRSASMKLRDLEQGLGQLVSKSRVIQDLLKLRKLFLTFACPATNT
jgi:hypothetical protein